MGSHGLLSLEDTRKGQRHQFHPLWLRERSEEAEDLHVSGQRLVDISALSPDLAVTKVCEEKDGHLLVTFSDGRNISYSTALLMAEAEEGAAFANRVPRPCLWPGGEKGLRLQSVSFRADELHGSKEVQSNLVRCLLSHGVAVVKGLPTVSGQWGVGVCEP